MTQNVRWTKSGNEANSQVTTTIHPDNYNAAEDRDTARVTFDDFTYYLNAMQLPLSATLEFDQPAGR